MYAIKLKSDFRIAYATEERFVTQGMVIVESLPEGNVIDYKYIDGEYVYDPIIIPEPEPEPTILDRIEAQALYTAMMTGTLLEGE